MFVLVLKCLQLAAIVWSVSATTQMNIDTATVDVVVHQDSALAHCKILSMSRNKKSLRFELETAEHKFEIKMASMQPESTSSSSPKHTAWIDGETVEVDIAHHHWMTGVVVNHPGSSVRMHVDTTTPSPCDSLNGMIRVGDDMFVVDRHDGDGVLRLEHEAITLTRNMNTNTNTKNTTNNSNNNNTNNTNNTNNNTNNNNTNTNNTESQPFSSLPTCNHQAPLAEQLNLPPWNPSLTNNNNNNNHNNSNSNTARARRASNKACFVFLDADSRFYEQWKGDCIPGQTQQQCTSYRLERVTVKMIDILHLADHLYQSDSVVGNLVELHVEGTHIMQSNLFQHGVTTSNVLSSYKSWLAPNSQSTNVRGGSAPISDDVCLNYLFSHTDMSGSSVGTAYYGGGSNNAGGLCGKQGWNSGMVSSLYNSDVLPHWKLLRVMAHELGHSFGAGHDQDQNNAACSATHYVMYSTVDNNKASTTATKLSSCSKNAMQSTITSLGVTSWMPNCLLAINNVCSDNNGEKECCSGNVLKPSGTVCGTHNPLDVCVAEAECDGIHPECPMGHYRPNDDPCVLENDNHGVCYDGECSHLHQGYCQVFYQVYDINTDGCTVSNRECVRTCEGSSSCLSSGSSCGMNYFIPSAQGCPMAPVGSPCVKNVGGSSVDGLCTSNGACAACNNGACDLNYWSVTSQQQQCDNACPSPRRGNRKV